MVFRVNILGKHTWMTAISATVMVLFWKVPFWKYLDRNCIQSSFSTIARNSHNSKDTLKLKILRTLIKIRANWVNLVFKSNPVLIDIMNSFCHNLFTILAFYCWYSTEFEFHLVPLRLFCKKNSNFLMRLNIHFLRFSA